MTDLEATRACALAIDLGCYECPGNKPEHTIRLNGSHSPGNEYWPLKRDDQAMALVKKLKLRIGEYTEDSPSDDDKIGWRVWPPFEVQHEVVDACLNRAIVLCSAGIESRRTEPQRSK